MNTLRLFCLGKVCRLTMALTSLNIKLLHHQILQSISLALLQDLNLYLYHLMVLLLQRNNDVAHKTMNTFGHPVAGTGYVAGEYDYDKELQLQLQILIPCKIAPEVVGLSYGFGPNDDHGPICHPVKEMDSRCPPPHSQDPK